MAAFAIGTILSMKLTYWVIGTGKNDLGEAGICVAALLAQLRGRSRMAAVLWGGACAAKINGFAFAGLAWIWHEVERGRRLRGRWRPDAEWIGLAILPVFPWLLKSWLLRGDPLYPAFSSWWPGSLWDAGRQVALELSVGRHESLASLTRRALMIPLDCQPLLLVACPVLIYLWRRLGRHVRQVTVATVVSYVVFALVVYVEMDRLTLPIMIIWCGVASLVIGMFLEDLPEISRVPLLIVLCLVSWAPTAGAINLSYDGRSIRYLTGVLTSGDLYREGRTTIAETQEAVRGLVGLRGLLLIDDHMPYRWPGKVQTEDFFDRKPSWVLTKEAIDAGRIYIRLRQRGITHIAENFVAGMAVSAGGSAYKAYPWDRRQLTLLRDFMKQHTEVAVAPRHCDSVNGGYYVYRVVSRPEHSSPLIYYLPGITEVIWQIYQPVGYGLPLRARERALYFVALLPDVGSFQMLGAVFAYMGRDYKDAASEFGRLAYAGMVGDFLHGFWGMAALQAGDNATAIRAFDAARGIYPGQRAMVDENEARAYAGLAMRNAEKGSDLKAALAYAQKAVALWPDSAPANLSLGVVCLRLGRVGEARGLFEAVKSRHPEDWPVQQTCLTYLAECSRLQSQAR